MCSERTPIEVGIKINRYIADEIGVVSKAIRWFLADVTSCKFKSV